MIRSRRTDNRADFFLALLTFWSASHISGWMLGYAGWYDSRDAYSQFMFYYPFSTWFVLGPLIYFFVKAKTKSNFRMTKKDYRHWIIPGLSILWVLICFGIDVIWKQSILGETLAQHGGTRGSFAQNPYGPLSIPFLVLRYILLFYYLFISVKHYLGYKDYIVSQLSIAEEVDFKWVRNILYTFAIAVVFWFFFDLFTFFVESTYSDIWWGYLFWGIVIFYITICGFKDDSHINNQINFDPALLSQKSNEENIATEKSIPLGQLMQEHKSYLKPNLNLNEFAKELKIPPPQLSRILNKEFNQNFNEFVNEFRIKEVIEKLNKEEYSHYSILGIALECGFNSKATFNRVFKTQMGMSPSQYKKSPLKKS